MDERRTPTRRASMMRWFEKHVRQNEKISEVWMSGKLGPNEWLRLIQLRRYPKWAREGNRKRLFRTAVKLYAANLRQSIIDGQESAVTSNELEYVPTDEEN